MRKPYTNPAIIAMPSAPRSRCNGQCTRSSERAGTVASTHSVTSGSEDNPRNAATCSGGYCDESSFNPASINANSSTAASMSRTADVSKGRGVAMRHYRLC